MILQADDMKKETSIEVNNIEQQYECRGMCAIRRAPEYWTTLGSSKTRTSEQAIEGQRLIKQQLEELPPNTTVAFTDGSCMGNPGPCGAGAIIYNNEEEETIQYPVSNRGSILLAELVAIKLVLEKIDNYNYRNVKQLNIYSDSQSAIGIITLNWKSENYHKTIQEIKNRKIKLEQKGFSINIIWTPGHSDIEGNEQADRLAKAAAKEADNREEMSSITTKQDIKQAARTSVIKKWKTQWESSEVGRRFFNHHPDASKNQTRLPIKKHFNILNSLRSGYSKLKGYQHFINRHVEDNKCTCGEIESVEHFLLSCDNYSLDREKLRQSIYFKTGTLNLDLEELLNTEASADIQYAVSEFIDDTRRFDHLFL
ncbi:RNASEH1 [Mytilus edulis]|uniref:RnhA n=1 Tax=Mytilus edulis TaxID=6550 RepID=A0A8S3QZ69_MYTED|nr:RNASEH1 [Mytilus edulis]